MITRIFADSQSHLPMSVSEVLYRLTLIVRGDMGDFIDSSSNISLDNARIAGLTHLVKRYRKRGNTTSIELQDRLKALILLAQYHQLISKHRNSGITMTSVDPKLAESDVNFANDFAK